MDWKGLEFVWDEILAFFDRVFQWLKYLFTDDEGGWNPEDYPTITD